LIGAPFRPHLMRSADKAGPWPFLSRPAAFFQADHRRSKRKASASQTDNKLLPRQQPPIEMAIDQQKPLDHKKHLERPMNHFGVQQSAGAMGR